MHHALLHKPDANACNDGTQVDPATRKAADAGTAKKVLRFWMQLKIIRLLLLFFADLKSLPLLASLVILITSLHHFI